jgi:hypothetical protein
MAAAFSLSVGVIAAGQTGASASPKSCYSTCPASASLTASSGQITYGNEQVEVFTVKVTPRIPGVSGVPTGTVSVKTGFLTLCSITLSGGSGSCSPGSTALKASFLPHLVIALYDGDSSFSRAWSNIVGIKVNPSTSPTTTTTTTTTTTIPKPPKRHRHQHWPWWF